MGDFIFGGVLAAAKESKLLGADRLNRMIECDNGASAFKLATEAGFGGGAVTLDAASAYERGALVEFVKRECPDEKIKKFILAKNDFFNAEALVKSKYLKTDLSDVLAAGGMYDVAFLKDAVFDDDYSALVAPLKDALTQADKLFVEDVADGFLINNLFNKAYYKYLFSVAKSPVLRKALSFKVTCVNLIAAYRCNGEEKLFKQVFLDGGELPFDRLVQLPRKTQEQIKKEFLFDDYRTFAETVAAEIASGKPPVLAENVADSHVLKIFKDRRFDMTGDQEFLLYCLYKQNEITNVNVIVVGLNAGADKNEIRHRLRECYEG